MAHANGLEQSEGRLTIDMVGSINTPFDNTLHRSVRIRATDETNQAVPIRCVKTADNGLAARFNPPVKGIYKFIVEYTFEVPDTREVEAKMIILDGRFTGYPALTREADQSWVTGRTGVGNKAKSPTTPVDDFLKTLRERDVYSVDSSDETGDEKPPEAKPHQQQHGDRSERNSNTDNARESGGRENGKDGEKGRKDSEGDSGNKGEKKRKHPRVSLEKQLTQERVFATLVGASDVETAARKFSSLDEVTEVMKRAGLKNSHLIFGIDYTASNKTQGLRSFRGKTLEFFMSDPVIPAFGFGDVKTSDTAVFPLYGRDGDFCSSFGELLEVYNSITPKIILSGPTNFAPIIKEAIEIYKAKPNYYLLVIVADGQVNNEPATLNAIVRASEYPISILVVGVGDGPWDTMNEFDLRIPTRKWDNFDFVDFHTVTHGAKFPEAAFAVHALSGLPDQYAAITRLGLL